MEKSLLLIALGILTPFTVHLLSGINYYWDYVENAFCSDASAEIYDFIIVGAGSSGAVVAHRLASQNYKVLLLEAGGDPTILNSVPGLAMDLLSHTAEDWNYKSIPQKNSAFSHKNQQYGYNRGKALGGSGTLNYMMYLRGNPMDYDNWANITGDPEWKYKNLLPFFKKSIKEYKGNFQKNRKHYEPSPYGFLTVGIMQWERMTSVFNDAGKELGYPGNIDANGPQIPGVGSVEVTQKQGARHSTYSAILQTSNRKNLRISKYSHATKIKLDKSGRAIGVWYTRHGTKYLAKASKEIIASAGAIDSPKLLMLTGIGPKQELEKLGIKSKVDLPVGKNLQDHYGSLVTPFLTKEASSFIYERDLKLSAFYEYFTKGTGVLTVPNAVVGQFFYVSSKATGTNWPDIQTFFIAVGPSRMLAESFKSGLSLKQEVPEEMMMPFHAHDGFVLYPVLVRPKSRGVVTLKDKNSLSDPLIDPRPFSHPDDMIALIDGINAAMKLANTKSFQAVETKFVGPKLKGCEQHEHLTTAYWECYTRHTALNIWHPVGTCKMSHKGDPTAVVDSKLRVLGVSGLRVIDASIMPVIVNANTNAPSIMIGEKGSDIILEYWASQKLVSDRLEHFLYSDNAKCFYSF